jgi:hypothetical protein
VLDDLLTRVNNAREEITVYGLTRNLNIIQKSVQ